MKRLTRDGELRESFGRYALIGEATAGRAGRRFDAGASPRRVNLAIDGEPAQVAAHALPARAARWWRPLAGVTVAAGVAAVAIVALQQRAISPRVNGASPITAQNVAAAALQTGRAQASSACSGRRRPREALSYTVPATSTDAPSALAPGALDELCVRAQQVLLRLGPARSAGGLADRGR